MALAGHASSEGTRRYAARFAGRAAAGHFRESGSILLSSLGIGTYLGEPDVTTDELYSRAISSALTLGANVIDAAINYRYQRSERVIAAAVGSLVGQGLLDRTE
ncbi:MAG: aldo/keto reductase, partial [Candidatus Acidiferrales bacterium]